MDKKDKLHELIRSMSMAEKRRFTIDVSQNTTGKERKYILLFDVIVDMKEYHADKLIEVLKTHNYSTQHLASDKNYLYNLIIKSLSSFYSGKNTSLNIKEKLHQVEILFERGLFAQCLSILKKTETQANKYDLYALLIEISTWKNKIYERLGEYNLAEQEIQHTFRHMALLDNRMAYKKLIYQIQELSERTPVVRTQEEFQAYEQFIAHPFMVDESIALSFLASLDYWRIYQKYYRAHGDIQNELLANQKLLALMDAQADFIEEFPYEYAIILSRILRLNLTTSEDKFEEAHTRFLEFPKKAKKLKRSVEARVNIDSSLISLEKLIRDQKFEEAALQQPEVEKTLNQYRKHTKKADIFLCHFLSAIIFIKVDKVKGALEYVNTLLNHHRSAASHEFQISLEILNMVVHYHMGNYSILKYRAKSLTGQLSRSQRLYEPEEEIFRFFTRLSNSRSKSLDHQNEMLDETYNTLCELAKDPLHKKAFQHFDFLTWLEGLQKELKQLVN